MKESFGVIESKPQSQHEKLIQDLRAMYAYTEGRPVIVNENIEGHAEVRAKALEQIADLEKEKAEILERLERTLSEIEQGADILETTNKDARSTGYDADTNSLFIFAKKGEKHFLTKGELLTDGRWGVEYRLNATVPKEIRTEYYTREAERKLAHLHNQQIAWNESTRGENDYDEQAYLAVLNREQSSEDTKEALENGILAEMVIASLLERLAIDHKLNLTIREPNPYEDVKNKADLILDFENGHTRGAVIEQSNKKEIGIQLSTSTNQNVLSFKKDQVGRATARTGNKIKDVVFVAIPLRDMQILYKNWQIESKKKVPGGPDKILSRAQQEQIIRGIFAELPTGTISQDKIEAMLNKMLEQKVA